MMMSIRSTRTALHLSGLYPRSSSEVRHYLHSIPDEMSSTHARFDALGSYICCTHNKLLVLLSRAGLGIPLIKPDIVLNKE